MSVRSEREKRGWTQRELAHKMGVSDDSVRGWESGRHNPNARDLGQLVHLFGGRPGDYVGSANDHADPALVDEAWRLLARGGAIMADDRWWSPAELGLLAWLVGRQRRTLATWARDPGRVDRRQFEDMRHEITLVGQYRTEVQGSDPWASERRLWLDLIDRIVGGGGASVT